LIESVSPRPYGGTERIVSYLTEELVLDRSQSEQLCNFLGGLSRCHAGWLNQPAHVTGHFVEGYVKTAAEGFTEPHGAS
jgi:hypothetical protein